MLFLPVLLGGCTHVNQPLSPVHLPVEQRQRNQTHATLFAPVRPLEATEEGPATAPVAGQTPADPALLPPADADGYFVGVAISGGGSRSANFSAACLFKLQELGLLQQVDYISSVSGGSLTAAAYCLYDDEHWNPQTIQKRLTHSFATDIAFQMILPWNALALWLTHFDRSDLLADSFRTHLFSTNGGRAMTFADLRADRPRLLINATDLQSGRRFVFTNEMFDQLNSDLSQYPIASAVAASAAFPVVMHHVTLRDFSTSFKQYVHLIDGGVTDNLGVESLVEAYGAHIAAATNNGLPSPYPNGAILLVIDAKTAFDARLSDRGDIGFLESLEAGTGLTSTSLLARAASATMADIVLKHSSDDASARELRAQMKELETAGHVTMTDRSGKPVRVVHLALERVDDLTNLPFASFSERVNNIATYFNIADTEAYNLYQAADLLVEEQFAPVLREIASDLEAAR